MTRQFIRRMISAAIVICGCAATLPPALATITAQWFNQPIIATTDQVTPPPGLTGYACYDLIVTVSAGDPTREARIAFSPGTNGSFFQHVLGNGAPNFGPPNPGLIPPFPAMAYDTFLDSPLPGGPVVLGSNFDTPGLGVFNTSQVSIWMTNFYDGSFSGNFRLMRVTLNGSLPGNFFPPPVQFRIPEPASLGLLALAAPLALRRNRFKS